LSGWFRGLSCRFWLLERSGWPRARIFLGKRLPGRGLFRPLAGRRLGMYLRTIGRRNKDGSEVRYVQLAHNEWDPERKCSIAKVIHSFGREDQLDRAALARLVGSLSRVLEPEQALIATAPAELEFVGSVAACGAWALDGLWRRLGIDTAIERLLGERRLDARAERLVFAMVANRALAPFSKLACCECWLRTWRSRGWARTRSVRTRSRCIGRWTGCWRSRPSWPSRCTGRPPTC
jgi:hypothetical protein